jgi:hypothetical protein
MINPKPSLTTTVATPTSLIEEVAISGLCALTLPMHNILKLEASPNCDKLHLEVAATVFR